MLCSLFQLYDRVEGILSCSMQWRSTSMLLKFHISKISYQKHLHQMKGLSPDNFFFLVIFAKVYAFEILYQ